jgi:hypothetical protein
MQNEIKKKSCNSVTSNDSYWAQKIINIILLKTFFFISIFSSGESEWDETVQDGVMKW